jgi:DNA-directed RNA polymerase subunit RPC12/RpoP
MSCPECGTKIYRKSLVLLAISIIAVIMIFGISLYFLSIGYFLAVTIFLLIAIRFLERGYKNIAKSETRCPACGHVIILAHPH